MLTAADVLKAAGPDIQQPTVELVNFGAGRGFRLLVNGMDMGALSSPPQLNLDKRLDEAFVVKVDLIPNTFVVRPALPEELQARQPRPPAA